MDKWLAVTNENQAECKENFLLVGRGKDNTAG